MCNIALLAKVVKSLPEAFCFHPSNTEIWRDLCPKLSL